MAEKKVIKKSSKAYVVGVKAAAVKRRGVKQASGFAEFIRTQGVVGLAVGLVLGGALTIMVKSFIDNVVMPPIGLFLGSAEGLKGLSVTIGKTSTGQGAVLHYGTFLNDFINFLVIAVVIYIVVHVLGLDRLDKSKE
jgi:large conductance mechanosensitive channel